MLSAYVCCIYIDALQNVFTLEANTMNPDQTAPLGQCDLGPYYLRFTLQKYTRKQTFVVNDRIRFKNFDLIIFSHLILFIPKQRLYHM